MQRSLIIAVHDILVVMAALPVAIVLREQRGFEVERVWDLAAAMPVLAAAAVVAALVVGPYRALWRRLGSAEIVTLAQFVGLALLIFYVAQFLVDRLDALPRSAPVLQFMTAMLGLLGSRLAYETYRRARGPRAGAAVGEPVLLVGAGDGTALLVELLRQHPDHGEPVGILCDEAEPTRRLAGVPIIGRLDQLDAALARLSVQGMRPARLVLTRPHHELGRNAVYDVVERAAAAGLEVKELPDMLRLTGTTAPATAGDGGGLEHAVLDAGGRKRAFEAVVAAVGLLVLSPLLLVTALAVAVGIQRPVLFVQVRPGRNRRPYKLIKFRTMRDPTDPQGRVLSDDERTPWVGGLLRRLRLDELPQLWNVLIGDMALIGPRPLLAADLDAMPDGGRARAAVRPGITGWAQVNGGHQLTGDEKLALDLWYAANANLRLDLRILWLTLVMMVVGERRQPMAIAAARESVGLDRLAVAK